MRLKLFILILTFSCIVSLFAEGDEGSSYEKFLFISVDTGYTIKGLLDGGAGIGAQIEFANLRYVGVSGNFGYVSVSTNFTMFSYGGAVLFYPEGYGPYGYYIKVGCMYNSAERLSNDVYIQGTMITVPLQLGMKFIFDELWGLTIDPYLEGEIYIGLSGFYQNALTMKQSIGFRLGFTF